VPPQRPPSDCHICPRKSQIARGVVLAGRFATRRSAATDGHCECPEFGLDGLMLAWWAGERYPLMIQIPPQRSPWAEKAASAPASSATRRSARAGSRVHRRCMPQLSVVTRSDRNILAEAGGEKAHVQRKGVGSGGARGCSQDDGRALPCHLRQPESDLGVNV